MKIAFVYDAVYPWVKGGVERRIYEIGRRLSQKHEIHWFGLRWWKDGEKELDGIFIHGIGSKRPLYVNGRRSIGEAVYFGFRTLFGLKENFDVIDSQAFPYFSCFSSKMHSVARGSFLIVTWHELWGDYWFEYLGLMGLAGLAVERIVSKLADRHVAVSDSTRRGLEEIGVEAEMVPNGIDFKKIQEVRASDERSDVVFAGRLVKEKNVDLLIKSIRLIKSSVPDIKCIIIGDGPERRRLETLAGELELGSNIVFKGFLEKHEEVISYIKASKVFVLPSTREGFGIVVLEANACGLPVVTVKHERNAACDLIKDNENGFKCLISAENIMKKTLEAMRKNMRTECIETALRYDWSNIVDSYEHLLEDCFSSTFKR